MQIFLNKCIIFCNTLIPGLQGQREKFAGWAGNFGPVDTHNKHRGSAYMHDYVYTFNISISIPLSRP